MRSLYFIRSQQNVKRSPDSDQWYVRPTRWWWMDHLTQACDGGYTSGMKTAISLPDRIFRAAERHARRAQKSRSQLYADAIAEYLARHAPEEVTDAMNRVVDQLTDGADPFVAAASRRVLEDTPW